MHTSKNLIYAPLPPEINGVPIANPEKKLFLNIQKEFPLKSKYEAVVENMLGFVKYEYRDTKPKKLKPKRPTMSRRARKQNNLLKLPKTDWDYAGLEEMRVMWKDYMNKCLNLNHPSVEDSIVDGKSSQFHVSLSKCELIGADITVVQSRVPSVVDISGTIVLETKETFQVVTKQNELKVLLKKPSVFEFRLGNLKFSIYGNALLTRPRERCIKKIKSYINFQI